MPNINFSMREILEPNWKLSFTFQVSKRSSKFNVVCQEKQLSNKVNVIRLAETSDEFELSTEDYAFSTVRKSFHPLSLNTPYLIEIQQTYSRVDGTSIYNTNWKINGNQVKNLNNDHVEHISELTLLSPGTLSRHHENEIKNYNFEVIPTGKMNTFFFFYITYVT